MSPVESRLILERLHVTTLPPEALSTARRAGRRRELAGHLAHLTGRRGWVGVTGTRHYSFTDFASIGDQAGLPQQSLPGVRCLEITRGPVAAWIVRRLPPAYPEVVSMV